MTYSRDQLKNILCSYGYPMENTGLLASVIQQIEEFSEEAKQCFSEWVEHQTQVKFEINGITSDFLRNIRKQNEIAVLLSYDHLLKESKIGKSDFAKLLKEKNR